MLSGQILQSTIAGLKQITRADLCIMDAEGNVLASTFTGQRNFSSSLASFVESSAESKVFNGYQYFKLFEDEKLEYILIVGGSDNSMMVGKLAGFHLSNLMTAYEDRFDRENFMKNLLLDNLLPIDIYNRARKLGIESDNKRLVLLVEASHGRVTEALEILREAPFLGTEDFVFAIDEDHVIMVSQFDGEANAEESEALAQRTYDYLKKNMNRSLRLAYGNVADNLRELSRSYNEARSASDVGKIFFHEKEVIAYNQLGLGRLIYQIPIPLCKMFIREIFHTDIPERFDEETLMTIEKFFENSLNISETSRQLYIHRNTLVYRLDKLQRQTGMDLRNFEDAITLKIALMVLQYMQHIEQE